MGGTSWKESPQPGGPKQERVIRNTKKSRRFRRAGGFGNGDLGGATRKSLWNQTFSHCSTPRVATFRPWLCVADRLRKADYREVSDPKRLTVYGTGITPPGTLAHLRAPRLARDGTPPKSHESSQRHSQLSLCPRWASAVAPIAEWLAGDLFAGHRKRTNRSPRPLPTPLTQARRSAGRGGVRFRSAESAKSRTHFPRKTCVVCGADLQKRRHRYCMSCRPVQAREAVSKAHEVLRTRRLAGNDPAHGGETARRRGKRNSAALRANFAWERKQSGTFDPGTFAREIQPKLAKVSLAEMIGATGLSRPYCAMIRRGARVPHPRHWEALRTLAS